MASSAMTADRRWASSRKSGMTVLGKVPKPINLPSQRLENHGLDPNVEIVPKGTITWGSRPNSSSNPWNSSSILSPKIEVTSSSPPDLIGRPGSSGSSTRPSTGNTDRQLGSDPSHAWGPNSRPSSASGSFASGHPLASPNRPRSADTRPGSAQLSRFAESSGENKGFSLSSGDFPTLGTEKPGEPRRGHSSHGRPTSGAGRDARVKEALDTLPPGHDSHPRPTSGEDNMSKAPNSGDFAKAIDGLPKTQNVNILKTDDPSNTNWYPETPYQYPSHPYHQPGPNQPSMVLPVPAPQYDVSSWRASPPQPMQQAPEGAMWYPPGPHAPGPHGPGPYRPSGPPNNYPIDPFVYYPPPPHFRPPNTESAPRPHMPPPHNPYMMPSHPVSIPGRHGPHAPYAPVPPVSYDGGFYGPSRAGFYGNRGHNHNNNRSNFNNSNNNQQAVVNQGHNLSPRSSVSESDAAPKQYKVLLKHREEEKKDEKQPEPTVMTRGKEHSSELSENQQQPIVRKNSALIQKIEELNSKARNLESSHVEIKEGRPKPGEGILGTPSGLSEAGAMSIHRRTGEEVTAIRQHHADRKLNEQRRMRQRPLQPPNQVVPLKKEAILDSTGTTSSDRVLSLQMEGDEGMASDANLPPSDPAEYEYQRALLKEKAAQRAKELQREEEERIREQRAKALAKLEELNRRATTQKEPVHEDSEPSPSISDSFFQQAPSNVIVADTHIQEVPQTSAELSKIGTVTLSFGTISEVQITTGKVTHILEVPISSTKTGADAGAFSGALGTGSGADTSAGAVVSAGIGASSHARHHHARQLGYKKRNISNLTAPLELRSAEKLINVENPTEPLKQTDAQVPSGESTKHRDDTVSIQRKRGNKNPKSRIKTEVPMPVSVPVQPLAPLEERPGKGINEKIQTGSSTAPIGENSNLVPPEDSSKEVSKRIEVESHSGGGNNRAGPHWKAQQQRRPVRNNRPSSEKSHGNETVMWAPVKHPKEEIPCSLGTSAAVAAPKIDGEVHAGVKTKRAEIERYVPKPQLSQLDESTNAKAGETSRPSEAKAEEVDSRIVTGGNNANNLNKSIRRGGKPNASWRQRVGPVNFHETISQDPTDGQKTPASDTHTHTQLVMHSHTSRDYEDSNPDGRPRRHNGHKLYKATGSNYTSHGNSSCETDNIGDNVDGAIVGLEGKSENMESGSCEVLNYSSNTRSQHWKPKSQSQSHGKGNTGWQKVVSDKVGPASGKVQDEDKPVTCTAAENTGSSAPRRQRDNARQYKSGTDEDREINRDPQPVVGTYQRVTGEGRMEGGKRVASGSRYRGRGRDGHFAHRSSELNI